MNACKMKVKFLCTYDINCEFLKPISENRNYQCKYSYDCKCLNTIAQAEEVKKWLTTVDISGENNE